MEDDNINNPTPTEPAENPLDIQAGESSAPTEVSEEVPAENPPPSQNASEGQVVVESAPAPSEPTTNPPAQQQANPSTNAQDESNIFKTLLAKCKNAIAFKKQKKLEKILQFAKQKGKITNDDVQKLILVSDKTAERYLQELVKQGKLRKVGSTSQIYYELLN